MPVQGSVSVIIPAHNRSGLICRAVRSVLEQTHPAKEIIVVDDASTDGTADVVRNFCADVKVIRFESNKGAQAARAAGIRAATGEWIAFLDSDDEWLPRKLEWQLQKASEGFSVIHGQGLIRRDGREEPCSIPQLEGEIYQKLLQHPGPLYPCIMARRECFEIAGRPDPDIVAYQEWDMSLTLARRFKFGHVDKALFVYEVRPDSISKDGRRGIRGYEQIVRKWWPEIMAVAGRDAGCAHYVFLANQALARNYLTLAARFTAKGARLAGQNPFRCLLRDLGPYCRSRLWELLASVGKRVPGVRQLYGKLKDLRGRRG